MELLSALDNVLSQKAEETLTEFAAVKKADVQLQTQLGNRKGQIAANIIGAFAESQNSTFGWQVRAYGAENDTGGAISMWSPFMPSAQPPRSLYPKKPHFRILAPAETIKSYGNARSIDGCKAVPHDLCLQ